MNKNLVPMPGIERLAALKTGIDHDPQIMKYVPKSKWLAVKKCWKDSEGYWITLHEGYHASNTDTGCRTIHEWRIKELRQQISGIEPYSE